MYRMDGVKVSVSLSSHLKWPTNECMNDMKLLTSVFLLPKNHTKAQKIVIEYIKTR